MWKCCGMGLQVFWKGKLHDYERKKFIKEACTENGRNERKENWRILLSSILIYVVTSVTWLLCEPVHKSSGVLYKIAALQLHHWYRPNQFINISHWRDLWIDLTFQRVNWDTIISMQLYYFCYVVMFPMLYSFQYIMYLPCVVCLWWTLWWPIRNLWDQHQEFLEGEQTQLLRESMAHSSSGSLKHGDWI